MLVCISAVAFAQSIPTSVSYQGKLTNMGIPVPDGTHQVQFKLYSTTTGKPAFWTSGVQDVQTVRGLFTTEIGPLMASHLAGKTDIHLEVLAGNPLEPMTPRMKFQSVPFALQSSSLQLTTGAAAGKVLTSDASGNATWQNAATYTSGSGLALSNNQFSIATSGVATVMLADSSVTTAKISATGASANKALIYNGSSVVWGNPAASGLVLPISTTTAYSTHPFIITNTGAGTAGLFIVDNDSNANYALGATSINKSGGAAVFQIYNSSNAYAAVRAITSGVSKAGHFTISNSSNYNAAVHAETNGGGPAIIGHAGTGLAGEFIGKLKTTNIQVIDGATVGKILTSDASGNATWQQVGTGSISTSGASTNQALIYNGTNVVWGNPKAASLSLPYDDSVSSSSPAMSLTNTGTGDGIKIGITNTSNTSSGIYIEKYGGGAAIAPSALGNGTAISAYTRDGTIANMTIDSTTNPNTALTLTHKGTGRGAQFTINNSSSNSAAVFAATSGIASALEATATGNGSAGYFNASNTSNTEAAVYVNHNGNGPAIKTISNNGYAGEFLAEGTSGGGIYARTRGGMAGEFRIENATNYSTVVHAETKGLGRAGHYLISNTLSYAPSLTAETNGRGAAGLFLIKNSSNSATSLYAETNGSGPAIAGSTSGSGAGIRGETTGSAWAGYFWGRGASSNGVYISAPSGNVGLQVASGTKNAVVATSDGARLMYTEESTEVWFTDYGFGKLENGRVTVTIDPKFAETVTLTEPYHVFVQLNDPESEGVAVTNKTSTGFDVVELRHGKSNADFSYRIVAKRKGYETDRMKRSPSADNDPNLYPGK